MTSIREVLCVVLFTAVLLPAPCLAESGEPGFVVRAASLPIEVDGRLDEPDWVRAVWSEQFVDIVDGGRGWFDSRCAALWNKEALYVAFRLQEPRLRATLTDRDAPIYKDNDAELFVAGPDAYYELELNAFGTVYDVLWVWEDVYGPSGKRVPWGDLDSRGAVMRIDGIAGHVHPRGWRTGFISWNMPGLQTAVKVKGTINQDDDTDRGWTVEVAMPWQALSKFVPESTSWPPSAAGSVPLRIDCSRFQLRSEQDKVMERPVGWALRKHGAFDSHMPERFVPLILEGNPAE